MNRTGPIANTRNRIRTETTLLIMSVSINLSIHPSIHPSINIYVYILYIYLYIYTCLYLSIYPSIHWSIYPSIHLSVCLFACLPVCMHACMHVCRYIGIYDYIGMKKRDIENNTCAHSQEKAKWDCHHDQLNPQDNVLLVQSDAKCYPEK